MRAARLLNAPNAVSLLRLPLAVAFWLSAAPAPRVAILIAAAASDALDGWLARRRGGSVAGGAIIDPLLDKLFILGVIAALVAERRLAPLELALLLVRDALVIAGIAVLLALRVPLRLRARAGGKLVTALQLATLVAATAWRSAVLPLAAASAVAGVAAAVDYARSAHASLHRRAGDA